MRREFIVVGIILAALAAFAWYWKKKMAAGQELFVSSSGIGSTTTDLRALIDDQKVSAVVTAPAPEGPHVMTSEEIFTGAQRARLFGMIQ